MAFRTYLRALEIADFERTLNWHRDDDIWSMVVGPKYYVSSEYEKKWLEDTIFDQSSVKLAVCLKQNHDHIGIVSLTRFNWINRNAESHWMLGDKAFWGNGYATEAVMQLLDFGFQERGLHRISCSILENNLASRKVAQKCGYQEEGILRDAIFKNGRFHNLIVMSILQTRYMQVKQKNNG